MARAKELGDQFPSDTGDTLPTSVLANRELVDYNVTVSFESITATLEAARQTVAGFGGSSFEREEIIAKIVDLRDTKITDNGQTFGGGDPPETVLGDIFNIIDSNLVLNKEVYIWDKKDSLIARGIWRYDPDSYPDENNNGRFRVESLFPVYVQYVEGENGTPEMSATFKYMVMDLEGNILADSDNNPLFSEKPIPFGRIERYDDDVAGIGMAYFDQNEVLHLWDAGEYWAARNTLFPVLVRNDGGGDGDAESPATWTYSVRNYYDSADILGSGVQVAKDRPNGKMIAAPFDSIGMAFYDGETNILILWEVQETEFTETCP